MSVELYPVATEDSLGAVEVPSSTVPLSFGSCVDSALEFVPDPEPLHVPPEVAAVCAVCPVAAECLAWAIAHNEYGLWAATTRDQRQQMASGTQEPAQYLSPFHQGGVGSVHFYKQGCRCVSCRAAQTDKIRRQRSRRRQKAIEETR